MSPVLEAPLVAHQFQKRLVGQPRGIAVGAGAALVASEAAVHVCLGEALGCAAPERLGGQRQALGDLGGRGQVIVLTCTPGRYDGVTGAEVIELSV